jgi:hypothetical protein
MKADRILREAGFRPAIDIEGRASIADLFKNPAKRCGIYVLDFRNGDFYVGQAADVVRRHAQHCRNHQDISAIRFRPTAPDRLNRVEADVIAGLEGKGHRLRNIALTSVPPVDSDFDLLMSKAQQERWLRDLSYNYHGGTRSRNLLQRRRYQTKFERLADYPRYEEVRRVLRQHCRTCLPGLRSSEMAFWSLSCLPNSRVLARVNLNWQEVFAALVVKGTLCFYAQLSRHILREHFGPSYGKLLKGTPELWVIDNRWYSPGGRDQTCLFIATAEVALSTLKLPGVLSAIRDFNLRLMRKGPCIYGRNHCPQLADLVCD